MSTGFKCTLLKCSRRRDSVNDMQKQNSSRCKNLPRHYCINPIVIVVLSCVCVLFVDFLLKIDFLFFLSIELNTTPLQVW